MFYQGSAQLQIYVHLYLQQMQSTCLQSHCICVPENNKYYYLKNKKLHRHEQYSHANYYWDDLLLIKQ